MFSREEIVSRPTYWLTETQLDLSRLVADYLSKHGMSIEQLVVKSDTSFHHIKRMIDGEFNGSLLNLTKVLTAMGVLLAPSFLSIEDYENELVAKSHENHSKRQREGCCVQKAVQPIQILKR